MFELTPDQRELLGEIVAAKAPFMIERVQAGDLSQEPARTLYIAQQLAFDRLIEVVGEHLAEDEPKVFALVRATDAGRMALGL